MKLHTSFIIYYFLTVCKKLAFSCFFCVREVLVLPTLLESVHEVHARADHYFAHVKHEKASFAYSVEKI